MRGAPEQPNPNKKGLNIPIHVRFETEEETGETDIHIKPARREDKPRAIYIKQWMTEEYGFTEDCPGCDARRAGMSIPKPHSAKCRDRLEEAMKGDERGKKAQELVDERWQHWTAKEMERDDKKAEENKQRQGSEQQENIKGKVEEDSEEGKKNEEQMQEGMSKQKKIWKWKIQEELPARMAETTKPRRRKAKGMAKKQNRRRQKEERSKKTNKTI